MSRSLDNLTRGWGDESVIQGLQRYRMLQAYEKIATVRNGPKAPLAY